MILIVQKPLKALIAAGALIFAPATFAADSPAPVAADHAKQMSAGLELFKNGVGALLKEHCVECHGGGKTKGDFDLATREGLIKGGADGPAVVVGKSKESKLLKLLNHAEEPHMPSKKPQLPADAIAKIAAWIDAGAPYADSLISNAKVVKDRSVITEQDRKFWSFQPLARVTPPAIKTKNWARGPIDQFILAKLEAKNIKPNPAVDKRKLVRRVYFDLLGLPPTPEQIEAFVADTDPTAYEKLLDRLLADPHYGERWARHWLDLARFGESHGYEQDYDRPFAYHYRDFVIRALNDDVPYDKFVQWQIAGDELDADNPQAWFATGFLGAGTHATQITANQAEKERYDELDDKIQTIGAAMLGLSLGCARCHDHKYDPVPTADYYRLISTFTTTVRSDYNVDMNPAKTRADFAAWDKEHKPLVAALEKFEKEKLPSRFDAWLKTNPQLPQPQWLWLNMEGFKVSGGYYGINKSESLADGSRLVTLTAGSPDSISFTAKTSLTNITALRLEALADRAMPHHGPGWSKDGGFNLTTLTVTAKPLAGSGKPVSLKFVKRTATTDKKPAKDVLPWKDDGQTGRDHAAVFELEKPAGFAEGAELSFNLKFTGNFDRNLLGRVRVSLTTQSGAGVDGLPVAAKDFEKAKAVFTQPADKWKAADREALVRVYRSVDDDWRKQNAAVLAHIAKEPRPTLVKALVCSEGLPAIRLHTQGPDFYDKTYILRRGDLAQKQTEAAPSFLQVLMRTPEKESHWKAAKPAEARTPMMRAAFAKWITDVDFGAGNLAARVIVNRLWQHHFGQGIVTTPSDFGFTGARPTHPELLDWLAGELVKNGWKLKPLHKQIMLSAAYLQGTQTDAARVKVDPDNALFWHRPHQRLEAEVIRDSILAVGGRLDLTMFGPGSLDEAMTRRSIYYTIKRSKLIPMMTQFDAPDSTQSVGLRVNTTVAPQALLMMNNPLVRAAAKDFAKRLQPAADKSPTDAVKLGYALALGRAPTKAELNDSVAFIRQQTATYAPTDGPQLALADFCQSVLALNEFVYVE